MRARPYVLGATILASAMAFIDGSVVNIVLPTLAQALGASFSALQWVVNAYALALGGLILIGGGAGDRFGRRRVFTIGIVLFAAASLACAAAPNAGALIAARAIQGVGAALLVPQSLAIIAASFPKEVRGRAIGIWAGASAITTSLGPPLGGLLVDMLGWRSVFWINLPLSVVAIWLSLRFVPESRSEASEGPMDWPGGVFAVIGFGALALGLTQLAEPIGDRASAPIWIVAGFTGIAAFVYTESRAANPIMPLSLFKDRAFSGANVMTLFLYGALSAVLFLLPFDLVARRGLSASQVGLTLLPLGLVIGLLSRAAGALADRTGPRPMLTVGSLGVALSAGWLALGVAEYWSGVLAPVVLLAVGMAIVVTPLTTAVMNAAPDALSGSASGVNNAASRLAGLFAVAVVGAAASLVFYASIDDAAVKGDASRFGVLPRAADPARAVLEAAFVNAYTLAMIIAAVLGLLAAVVALVFVRPVESPAQATA